MQPQGFRFASKSSYPISRYLKVTSVPLAADFYKILGDYGCGIFNLHLGCFAAAPFIDFQTSCNVE